MIQGVGTDLVEIARFAALVERHGERLARRVLALEEMDAFIHTSDKPRFLAKRFAAKEAFGKATGMGIRAPVLLTSMWIGHDMHGKPSLFTKGELQALVERERWQISLSISDEREYALAFVVIDILVGERE